MISLAFLAAAVAAYYLFDLAEAWRWTYVVCAVAALYLNVFVGVAHAFMKWRPLKALAPTQKEPPFLVAQAVVLVAFVVSGVFAVLGFHPDPGT